LFAYTGCSIYAASKVSDGLLGRVTDMVALAGPTPRLLFIVSVKNTTGHQLQFSPPLSEFVLYEQPGAVYMDRPPFFAFAHLDDAGALSLSPTGVKQQGQTWHVLVAVDECLLSVLEKARKGGDLPVGLTLRMSGFELDGEKMTHFSGWVVDEERTHIGILPYRVAHSDWEKLREKLGYRSKRQKFRAFFKQARVRIGAVVVVVGGIIGTRFWDAISKSVVDNVLAWAGHLLRRS